MQTARTGLCLALVLAALLPASAPAQEAGGTIVKQGASNEDVYVAGGTVDMSANVDGDVLAAGGHVHIGNGVSGDVLAAGGNVTIDARVADDVRAAGGNVTISGAVGDDAIAAGGNILLAPSAAVGGRAWFGGGTVTVAGKVGKGLKVAGNNVVISGQVAGDVELYAESIEIRPDAVIRGNLRYASRHEARIAPEAKISGTITRAPPAHADRARGARALGLALYASLALTGIVLYLLFPAVALGAARILGGAPWKALGLGFALLVAVPLAVVLSFATLIGAWLGLIAGAIYFVLLLAGFFTGVLYLGEAGLMLIGKPAAARSRGWRALSIAAALVVVWIVKHVPVIGGLALFALLLFGLGALTLYLWRRYLGTA